MFDRSELKEHIPHTIDWSRVLDEHKRRFFRCAFYTDHDTTTERRLKASTDKAAHRNTTTEAPGTTVAAATQAY